jgi:hypothetical protein
METVLTVSKLAGRKEGLAGTGCEGGDWIAAARVVYR